MPRKILWGLLHGRVAFLEKLLNHAGAISTEMAKLKAHAEHDRFKERIQYELSPVEVHFIELFEEVQKKLKG